MSQKSVEPLSVQSDTFRFSMPPGWALQVSPAGVSFLGPRGEEVTLSSRPVKAEAREAPQESDVPVRRKDLKPANSAISVELTAEGPRPEVVLNFHGPAESRQALADLQEALRRIEWFPPRKGGRRRWKIW